MFEAFIKWRGRHNAEVLEQIKAESELYHKFDAGDKVRTKDGGPVMTVKYSVGPTASDNTGMAIGVHCTWHGLLEGVFSQNELEYAKPLAHQDNLV